jgi:hypothetical protein
MMFVAGPEATATFLLPELVRHSQLWEIDLVPWDDPVFESVSSDAYLCDACGWGADWIVDHLQGLKRYRKPVNSSEWGCDTFSGAAKIAAFSPVYREQNPYDENDQADYVRRYCDMLNRARISGCFYTQYNEDYDKAYGLYNPVTARRGRKASTRTRATSEARRS